MQLILKILPFLVALATVAAPYGSTWLGAHGDVQTVVATVATIIALFLRSPVTPAKSDPDL